MQTEPHFVELCGRGGTGAELLKMESPLAATLRSDFCLMKRIAVYECAPSGWPSKEMMGKGSKSRKLETVACCGQCRGSPHGMELAFEKKQSGRTGPSRSL
jgi:hypothetical protein